MLDGIIYLPEIKYRRILNRAFGPGGWGLAPRGETIVTEKPDKGGLVTREYALVCHGRYVSNPPSVYTEYVRIEANVELQINLHSSRRTRLL